MNKIAPFGAVFVSECIGTARDFLLETVLVYKVCTLRSGPPFKKE